MLADIDQIVGKLLVVFRLEIVFTSICIAATAAAVGHIVRTRVAERLEHSIRTLLTNLQQNLTLSLITIPMILIAREILETLHLSTKSLAPTHVMKVTMCVFRVITSTYIITEMAVVKTCRAGKPSHNLIYLLIIPFTALTCPPAERNAPSIELLTYNRREHSIGNGIGR